MSKARHDLVMRIFKTTGKSYDFVVKITTFWQDSRWKNRILEITDFCRDPRDILDLACGTGILTFALAEKFPLSNILGIDLQEEYLSHAEAKKWRKNIKNVEFCEKNAEEINEGAYDLITASYLPKYVDLDLVIGHCFKMMRPGSLLIFHDFTYPQNHLFRFFYTLYWVVLKLLLWFSVSWREMGKELETIIIKSSWVADIKKALEIHGFEDITIEIQPFEIAAIVYARRIPKKQSSLLTQI